MLRLLALVAVLAAGPASGAPPVSRWSLSSLTGVNAFAVAGRTDSAILAHAFDSESRVWRSLDGGRTWTAVLVPGGVVASPLGFALASPHDSRTWYTTGRDGRTLVTRDGGDTWNAADHRYTGLAFGATPDLLYLAGAVSFFDSPGRHAQVSLDRGVTWRTTAPLPGGAFADKIAPALGDARVVYAWQSTRVFRSDDQGASWREVTPPLPTPAFAPLSSFAVDSVDPDIVYANGYSTLEKATFTSRDGGRTWTRVPLNWIVKTVPDPVVRGRAFAFSFNATVYETRDGGATWAIAEGAQAPEASPANAAPPWATSPASLQPPAALALVGGRRIGLMGGWGKLASVDLQDGALALGSDLWWNPAESGAGLTITQHASNRIFVVWFTYDASGAPVWRVIPDARWNDRTLTGGMFETTGPAYFQGPFDPSRVSARAVGTARLTFDDHDNATFVYESASASAPVTKRITRQVFAAPPADPFLADSVADLYWNPAEPGWGIAINHQASRIFAAWFVYGDDGKPLWIVMPDAPVVPQFAGAIVFPGATGDIYTTRGPPEGAPFDPAKVVATRVGTARLAWFSQNSVHLEYTAFGKTETRVVRRQPF